MANELRRRNVGEQKNNSDEEAASDYATQHDLFGPISGALLVVPVRIQGDGAPGAYERQYITRWINERGTSPTDTTRHVTVADLEPANDIQQEIRELVERYPNAQIVRDWLQDQPPWYTLAIQRVRNSVAPVVQAMSRAVEPIRQIMPSADNCKRCCAGAAEAGAGIVVGAGVGACMGCSCAIGLSGDTNDSIPMTAAERQALVAFVTPPAAIVGAAIGAVIGPEECLRCAGEACQAACRHNHYGGKRKTRKGKRKRRKTRKRKRKKTVKRKRKKKRKKTRGKRKK
jgi:hypothetical protein